MDAQQQKNRAFCWLVSSRDFFPHTAYLLDLCCLQGETISLTCRVYYLPTPRDRLRLGYDFTILVLYCTCIGSSLSEAYIDVIHLSLILFTYQHLTEHAPSLTTPHLATHADLKPKPSPTPRRTLTTPENKMGDAGVNTTKVAIIGGGLTGLLTAHALKKVRYLTPIWGNT